MTSTVVSPEADGRGGGGRIDAMPDGVLEHFLGFLPAEDAVRTSVLAPRWRHLWKSAAGLRIGCRDDDGGSRPVKEYRDFVDHLLLLRGSSPLEACEIRIGEIQAEDKRRTNLWVRHSILCKVRVLKVHICPNYSLALDDLPFISQYLTRLELHNLVLHNSSLDFSSCPVLEHLELNGCGLSRAKRIVSESLKHLKIIWCCFNESYHDIYRAHISAPNLVTLHIDDIMDTCPMLYSMPLLVEASVRFTFWCSDDCAKEDNPPSEDCLCHLCDSFRNLHIGGTSCVLLNGLSEAKSLALISDPYVTIFRGDLRWCPMFSNLRTLLLNDSWCVPDDFHALTCILEHSPVLEKLTLQLFSEGPKHNVEMKGGYCLMGPPATISEHLDIVEVKCEVVDERVLKVLDFLSTFKNVSVSVRYKNIRSIKRSTVWLRNVRLNCIVTRLPCCVYG